LLDFFLVLFILKLELDPSWATFVFCRLGWAFSKPCWVSPPRFDWARRRPADQPTFCRCYCKTRNPTSADCQTEP